MRQLGRWVRLCQSSSITDPILLGHDIQLDYVSGPSPSVTIHSLAQSALQFPQSRSISWVSQCSISLGHDMHHGLVILGYI
ncbi:hypothetical protein TanjilG_11547 [Lupinus angustifolius]|uniref:Uncharacterized protein n=1 Tax=Lupinus angustifolius TaxID=3871 RepID=A0A394DF79_LUPAN|nr:hypothetical protein TanjilG_11547 [Lupinus angustifolius]